MKATFVVFALAFSASVLAGTPPACLLQAVNTQQDPSDLSVVCGKSNKDVQQAIFDLCNNNNIAHVAQSSFIATCSSAGTAVAALTPTATSRTTGTATVTGSSTSTGSGARATGMAPPGPERIGSYAAAILAIAGAVAVL